jgi:hypothetical protein
VLRFEKLRALTRWPVALRSLRVCWQDRHPGRNCGRCAKCCQLAMGLMALGAPLSCFDPPPAAQVLARFASQAVLSDLERLDLSCILKSAAASGLEEAWVPVLSERLAARQSAADPSTDPKIPEAS